MSSVGVKADQGEAFMTASSMTGANFPFRLLFRDAKS